MPSRTDNFQKFVKQKKGSAIKEELKQEKRKEKKEKAAAIEAHFERKRVEKQQRMGTQPAATVRTGRPNKYPKKESQSPEAKANFNQAAPAKQGYKSAPKKQAGKPSAAERIAKPDRPTQEAKAPFKKQAEKQGRTAQDAKVPFKKKGASQERTALEARVPYKKQAVNQDRPSHETGASFKKQANKSDTQAREARSTFTKTTDRPESQPRGGKATTAKPLAGKTTAPKIAPKTAPTKMTSSKGSFERGVKDEQMPLNKYIAHGGMCSRRDAAIWVKDGKVTVNDQLVIDPGMKVSPSDVVKVGNKRVIPSKNFVYILLNKPKDYITTSEDPQGRKTVLDLVRTATTERVYPVGRLDRNTSGVLLLTNDGDLAQKLSHPKHEVKKVYEVKLDRALTKGDMDKIASGITLEDGFVAPDVIAYADSKDKSIIGVEIHSGRNRIVRRIFEHLKYDVKGLDRVMYAGLTKKDVQRGNWRLLKDKEIRLLKFMNQSFVKVND